ncbi:unnamed protein product [Moneuplotes crassus]|uniref:Uncharacterized protein n=1 Tax=Euplotes crassus TaxID=5936 RepID=A0AAD1XND9_EUPCR|nr:unnamed protein product [Moneuplotes crassus]
MANEHQRGTCEQKSDQIKTIGSYVIQQPKYDLDVYRMPFFESTVSKNYNPLVDSLKNKYDKIYNSGVDLKSIEKTMLENNLLTQPSGSTYLNKFDTSHYNGTILSPRTVQNVQLRGILKNSNGKKVSWIDSPKNTAPLSSQTVQASASRLTPSQLSMPIEEVNKNPKPYTGVESISGVYKPAVLPSNKKTVKLGNTFIALNNKPDPEIIDQLGGITKTIDTMEETLKSHELRPYEYCKVTYEPFLEQQYQTSGLSNKQVNKHPEIDSDSASEFFGSARSKSSNAEKPSSARIMSCSPFRAYKQLD